MVRSRDDEEIFGEAHEPVGLLRGRSHRSFELGVTPRLPERELELRLEEGERRAQLVARVGDETAFAFERVAESVQHLVQGQAEPADLVVRRGQREAPLGLGCGDRLRLDAHRVDRTECRGCDSIAEERREDKGDRRDEDEQENEPPHRLVPVVERRADDEHAVAGPGRDGPGRDAHGLCEPRHVVDVRKRSGARKTSRGRELEHRRRADLLGLTHHGALLVEHLREARL